ncbi:MAG: STAS domain-containing protein [Solirubrobacterales bacterium]
MADADGDLRVGESPVPLPWGDAAVRSSTAGRIMLVEVDGELDAPAVRNWSELLDSAIMEGATGVVVDLRGCRAIDVGCLSVLVAASGKLKARGDGGIKLVTTPGSPLERRVQASGAKRLDGWASAGDALRSLRDSP